MSGGLAARIEQGAALGQEVVFLDGSEPEAVPWGRLFEDACRVAAFLQRRGVAPGDRVALVGSTSRALLTTLEACWLAGAAAIVPPLRTRLEPMEEFRHRTMERITQGEVALVACDPELAEVVSGDDAPPRITFPELTTAARRGPGGYEPVAGDAQRTAILQFTSGSTADPKGVMITERCLLENLDALVDRDPFAVPGDTIVSWLPLYHDMGLVANAALAMTNGIRFVLAPPTRFVASPGSWMEWMQTFGGTWTLGPNFALAIAARFLRGATALDLGRCRRMGSGSEPVDPDVMDAMAAAGAAHHLDARGLFAAYGMAEATVVVSLPEPGGGFTADVVDGHVLEIEGRAQPCAPGHPSARRLARCGPPVRGMEVRIVDPETGCPVEERTAGEIELRGPSVVPGYFRRPDATAQMFHDGWLRTGDMGYFADEDLVVCGRLKDVIIIGGRNVFPEDLERPVHAVDGVRPGNVIAFGVGRGRKGEGVVVVAELKSGDPAVVRDGIAWAVRQSAGIRPHDIVLVAPGTLPKTSSGKLRRSACRARYQAGELAVL